MDDRDRGGERENGGRSASRSERRREDSADRDRGSRRDRDRKERSRRDSSSGSSSDSDSGKRKDKHRGRGRSSGSETDEFGRDKPHRRSPPPGSPSPAEKERMRAEKEERRREKEEKKRQKELMKMNETPEEKRARRLAKKAAKEEKRRKAMGWDDEYMGYSNASNPFGDQHLTDKFVWHKKKERQKLETALPEEEIDRLERQRMEENRLELAKVKERRLQREKEMEELEKQRELEARQREQENMEGWAEKEEKFHIEQARMRSRLRIEAGRAKPIDLLVKYITTDVDSPDVDIDEPYAVFKGLGIDDLEDLEADIAVYMRLGEDLDYWKDLHTIANAELEDRKKERRVAQGYETALPAAVREEVDKLFSNKTVGELAQLDEQIQAKLSSGQTPDVAYWESLLDQLQVYIARARLLEMHKAILRQKLSVLEADGVSAVLATDAMPAEKPHEGDVVFDEADLLERENASSSDESEIGEEFEGVYSPPLTDTEDGPVIAEKDFYRELEAEREAVFAKRMAKQAEAVIEAAEGAKDQDSSLVAQERSKGMEQGEAEFGVQVKLENKVYAWQDKYRPRKPRFFNRVHTGFEWNKYNQTHYDKDNPPPKMVQGYKFNIFYPDLLDRTKAPTYKLIPIPGEPDFCILRFSAGPPYEDIAFKIVNRDWEFAHRRGFRCQYDRGVFQLWFHFRRQRYRR